MILTNIYASKLKCINPTCLNNLNEILCSGSILILHNCLTKTHQQPSFFRVYILINQWR